MKKRNWSLFICIVLLLTSLHTPIIAGATGDAQDVDRLFTAQEVSEYRTEGTYPTKEGYVFAGWYKDSSRETPVTGNTPADGAYAKFVNKKVLSVMFQLTDGTTISSGTTNLRVITSVDSLSYQQVGFVLSVNGNSQEITSNTVYNTIAAYVDEDQQKYQPKDVFDETESEYFVTKVVTGIKNTSFKKAINFTPFWVTMDGTKVTATDDRTIAIFDEVKPVANSLGFLAGTHDGEPSVVETTTFGDDTVIKATARKVLFQDVIDTNGAQGDFFTTGYTHLQFDVYIESWNGSYMQMTTSQKRVQCKNAGGALESPDDPVTFGQYVRVYNQAGESARLKTGAWYTISMKVDADTSNDVSFVSAGTRSVFYLKNLSFGYDFPDETAIVDSLGFSAGSHLGDPSIVEDATFGEEDVKRAYARKVVFQDVIDASGAKGKFFKSGYTHLQFDVYIEDWAGTYMQVGTSGKNIKCHGEGQDWASEDQSDIVGNWVRFYNQNGARATLKTGAWYTISVKVGADSSDVSFVSAGTRSVFYLKNLKFTYAFPEERPLVANPLGFIAGSSDSTVVAEVTPTKLGDDDVIRVTGRKVCFQDVINARGLKGDFFASGYQYIAFDVYFDKWTASMKNPENPEGVNAMLVNTSFTSTALVIDENGEGSAWDKESLAFCYRDGVTANPKAGVWTTIYVKVDKTTSTDVSFCSPGTMSTFYLKNLTFTNSLPQ